MAAWQEADDGAACHHPLGNGTSNVTDTPDRLGVPFLKQMDSPGACEDLSPPQSFLKLYQNHLTQ